MGEAELQAGVNHEGEQLTPRPGGLQRETGRRRRQAERCIHAEAEASARGGRGRGASPAGVRPHARHQGGDAGAQGRSHHQAHPVEAGVGDPVTPADDRLPVAKEPIIERRVPGSRDAGAEVVPIDVEGPFHPQGFGHGDVGDVRVKDFPSQSRLAASVQIGVKVKRLQGIGKDRERLSPGIFLRRHLDLVSQAPADGQRRVHPPGVLGVELEGFDQGFHPVA